MNETELAESCAADWLARQDAGDWSEVQQRSFETWLHASTLNRVSYLRLQAAWRRADGMRALPVPSHAAAAAATRLPRFSRWRMAASVAVLAASAAVLGVLTDAPGRLRGELHATALGARQPVALADGSQLLLNTDTRLRSRLDDQGRRVWLEHGEAFFDVAHDAQRPFTVVAGKHRIEVLGTRFSVRRDGASVQVVVLEGRVRLRDAGADAAPVLQAGATVVIDEAGARVAHKTLTQLQQALGWRDGQLILDDMTLGEAAAEFNRYNTRKLVVADEQAARLRIGGRFNAHNVEAFARLLEHGFGLELRDQGERIVVASPRTGF